MAPQASTQIDSTNGTTPRRSMTPTKSKSKLKNQLEAKTTSNLRKYFINLVHFEDAMNLIKPSMIWKSGPVQSVLNLSTVDAKVDDLLSKFINELDNTQDDATDIWATNCQNKNAFTSLRKQEEPRWRHFVILLF